VVAADEKEGGIRATLNLGHTFGHAIEAGLGYGAWLHGEAVGTGMLMAAEMSHAMQLIDASVLQRTQRLLLQAGLPVAIDGNAEAVAHYAAGRQQYEAQVAALGTDRFLELMSFDKKVADGQLSLILLKGPLGSSVITDQFQEQVLRSTVDKYCNK
jgi:3-dehydroquinate synthase